MNSATVESDAGLLDALTKAVGTAAVVTSIAKRRFLSTDIGGSGETADFAVRVGTVQQLCAVVRASTERGFTVVPRGGGFSYTGGYTPPSRKSVLIDLRPMDSIVEINTEDMYVIVEVGCTWQRLYEALKAKGVRTPFFGPMSGYRSTVGGSLSQGGLFLGSTQYGTIADSVLALEVVLADGTLLRTGSWASSEAAPPFLRQYGPDVTGLFLNDSGAMGVKARAVLRLIRFPPRQAFGSFAFDSHAAALRALSAIGRSGCAAECYCWDPFFVRLMVASAGRNQRLLLLKNAIRAQPNWMRGLAAAARLALGGRRGMPADAWLLHVAIDDLTAAGASGKLREVRSLARAAAGRAVPATAPRALRGTPFTDFNTLERRSRRRNLPIHGIVPHSAAAALDDELWHLLAERAALMRQHDIGCGVILFAVSAQAVCIEPVLSWDDDMHFLHDRVQEISDIAALARHTELPAATQAAFRLRDEIKGIMRRHRCAHLQIARSYPWAQTREPRTLRLLAAIKGAVDPRCLMNRGALGLEP